MIPISLEGQNDSSKTDVYSWFDEIIGKSNSGIFKGTEYFERYKRTNEKHQFFKTYLFSLGTVIYDSQFYPNIPLKYDVFDHKLLVQDPNTLNAPIIELDKRKISEFTIDDHKFIHINKNEISGFYEVLLVKNSLRLYKKHLKEILRKSDEKVTYLDKQVASYQFKDKYLYLINYKGTFFKVKKANDLNAIFEDQKGSLKAVSKKYKSLRKTDPDGYMKAILTDVLTIVSPDKTSER